MLRTVPPPVGRTPAGAYRACMRPHAPFTVLIAGGSVAALEAALALRELAGGRVSTTLLTPPGAFPLRPLAVREPFAGPGDRVYDLARIAHDAGAELRPGSLRRLDAQARIAHTDAGEALRYDALLLAYGAEARPRFAHARTVDDRCLGERLRGLVQDVEEGYITRVAFVAAGPPAWPLPLYELALMTAGAAYGMCARPEVRLITAEPGPLALFGEAASRGVAALLARNQVRLITSAVAEVPAPGEVVVAPDRPPLRAQSVVAAPELVPRYIPGVPAGGTGFIPVDARCRVPGLPDVFAAGDATETPVRHGSLAAQQADTAAAHIARAAGVDVPAEPLTEPALYGMLLGGERPLYLTARLRHGRPVASRCSEEPLWQPPGKVFARYLAPYLHHADLLAGRLPGAALA